ncbi:MAG: polymer-forming cytoskeletal protein [Hyalangium sp.]|uniref:bactofilin family protein n=1 Tax=Hyalangium sp. TaxID=2028555 RepID=UPI00389B2CE2
MALAKETAGTTGNNTVVGPSILISGKLTGDEDLTVRGRVEGELTLSKTLIVETTGVVKANVAVRNAIVSGVVVGNINATESVELTREGRMVGDIRAPRVIIVDGASFRGRVDMGEVEPGRVPASRPVVARPTVRPGTAPARPMPPARPVMGGRPVAPPPPAARPAAKPVPPPPPPPAAAGAAGATGGAAAAGTAGKGEPTAPVPPVVGAGAKKKVVVKKKAR